MLRYSLHRDMCISYTQSNEKEIELDYNDYLERNCFAAIGTYQPVKFFKCKCVDSESSNSWIVSVNIRHRNVDRASRKINTTIGKICEVNLQRYILNHVNLDLGHALVPKW